MPLHRKNDPFLIAEEVPFFNMHMSEKNKNIGDDC
jgi:hypothetical protein